MSGHRTFSELLEKMPPERRARSDAQVKQMMGELASGSDAKPSFKWPRYSTKRLLALTGVAAVLLGVLFGPRRYVAHVTIGYGGLPFTAATVHPRFLKYKAQELTDAQLIAAEKAWILSPEIIENAVKRLEKDGVDIKQFGDDPVAWFRERVTFEPVKSSPMYVALTVSHWQSSHIGRDNNGRNALAWQALVALMSAYQENSYDSYMFDANHDGYRLPSFMFQNVERELW